MQKWSKFQFQSRILEQKIAISVVTILLVLISPQVFAQEDLDILLEDTNGVLIEQQKIIFEIGRDSDVRVKHVIETGSWGENRPGIIEIIPSFHTNVRVADEDGDPYSFSYDKETFEESKYVILNQKLGNYDLIVEYDLKDFMELKNGLWKKEIMFPFDVMVMIQDDIDYVFANSRPIDVSDVKGINCVGCSLTLEFFQDEEFITELVSFNEKEIPIEILSNRNISQIEYVSDGYQLLNFNVENSDQLIILKIPLELLMNPFSIYFTEKDDTSLDQIDKIRKTEFNQDKTHVNVSFRTSNEGIVSISGASIEEHEKILEQIKKRTQSEIESEIIQEEEKGIAIPISGSGQPTNNPSETMISEKEELSFADELSKGQTSESSQDYTIILVIIGVIAAIIIGVIIKIKKN
tara:strand:- start:1 stop:1224 length:1224 start_codon:yes stop_codon:yes gene_type:complete